MNTYFRNTNSYNIMFTLKCGLDCDHCGHIKVPLIMTPKTLKNVKETIIDTINNSTSKEALIALSGGEVGLYDQNAILCLIRDFRKRCYKPLEIVYQSSLVFDMTEAHKEVMKECDLIIASYDYKTRFKNYANTIKFFENLAIAKELNKRVFVTITLNKYIVEEVPPEMLMDFMLSMNINEFEINRMVTPCGGRDISGVLPKNSALREYMWELYKLYQKVKVHKDIHIHTFKCQEDSFNGLNYYEYGRCCNEDSMTFKVDGTVCGCNFNLVTPFYDVNTGKFDEDLYKSIVTKEKEIDEECSNCKYLKYCKGGCYLMLKDDTGCKVPYQVYDYLETLAKIR